MSIWIAATVFCMTIVFLEVLHYIDRRETIRRHQVETQRLKDERNELVYQIRDLNDIFAKERAEYLDRLTAESFREYKTQQIRMTKAQNKSDPEHPHLELL